MNAYLGRVSTVEGGRVQVSLSHVRVLTPPLRCVSPLGLVAPPPAVGDEVLVVATGAGMADAVVVGWMPTADQVLDAADRAVVVSTTGDVPTQTDPSQPIGGADVSGVLAR